jgi:hypothetical protein
MTSNTKINLNKTTIEELLKAVSTVKKELSIAIVKAGKTKSTYAAKHVSKMVNYLSSSRQ